MSVPAVDSRRLYPRRRCHGPFESEAEDAAGEA